MCHPRRFAHLYAEPAWRAATLLSDPGVPAGELLSVCVDFRCASKKTSHRKSHCTQNFDPRRGLKRTDRVAGELIVLIVARILHIQVASRSRNGKSDARYLAPSLAGRCGAIPGASPKPTAGVLDRPVPSGSSSASRSASSPWPSAPSRCCCTSAEAHRCCLCPVRRASSLALNGWFFTNRRTLTLDQAWRSIRHTATGLIVGRQESLPFDAIGTIEVTDRIHVSNKGRVV